MIKIKLKNKMVVYGLPDDLMEEVKEDLTIVNPLWLNCQRMKRYWSMPDKYILCFSKGNKHIALPIGYYEEILHKLNRLGLNHDTTDLRTEWPMSFRFAMELREYQSPAVEDILEYENGVLVAGTGAGKTVMALRIIAARGQSALVIVHTKELLIQWQERVIQFLGVSPEEIGVIGGGKYRVGRRITVGIVNSVCTRIPELKNQFGHIIVDECHRAPSKTFSEAVAGLTAMFKLGLTATEKRNDNLTELIFYYIGPIRHKVDKKMLIEEGHIMQPEFYIRSTGYITPEENPAYSTMIKGLTEDDKRNAMIAQDVADCLEERPESSLIILSDRKPHCMELHRVLFEMGIETRVLTGDTDATERTDIVNTIGDDPRPTIATGQLIGEGFDSKELDVMFLTTPMKFEGRVTQYIGRIMRPDKNKARPRVYDYVDWDVKVLRKSAHSRMKVYGKENIVFK